MATTTPDGKLAIQLLDGDLIRTHVGGSASIDPGYSAFFMNRNAIPLGTLEISIESPDAFDSFIEGSSDKIRFSNGLEVGSKIEFLYLDYAYDVGEIAVGSSKNSIKIKIAGDGYYLGEAIKAIDYKNSASAAGYSSSKNILFHLKTESGIELDARVQLTVSNANPITFYNTYDERIIGTDGNDVFNLEHVNTGGSSKDRFMAAQVTTR